jgi:inner membrane transporter RhtA
LVLLSVLAMQAGQAVAKLGFAVAGPLPITALRFGIGAVVLVAVWRPRIPTDRAALLAVLGLGTALAGVNVLIYEATARLPLGLAVTLQFTGALAVSLAGARRARHALWALLAAAGVATILGTPTGTVSLAGVAFALGSAGCWGAYILLNARVGARTHGGSGLALASGWAAVITVPLGLGTHPGAFTHPAVLGIGLVVALLCTVIANSCELQALRRIPSWVFGVLVSLEPAVAALAGLVLLGEELTALQWAAVAAIVLASIGITTDPPRHGDRSVNEPIRRRNAALRSR